MSVAIAVSRRQTGWWAGSAIACMLGLGWWSPALAWASGYHAIYVFENSPDGAAPMASLVADAQGRLYGTTYYGGANGLGTVFRLTPPVSGSGPWTEQILHSFGGLDGALPFAPVVLGPDGSVYGTEPGGGNGGGAGVVFRLANTPGWPVTVLHNFNNGLMGGDPNSGLVFGPSGLLYGTTEAFFYNTYAETGAVFSVSPKGGQYELLHSFGRGADGVAPNELIAAPSDYFSGFVGSTTTTDNTSNGVVFAQQVVPGEKSTETILYTFQPPPDVEYPLSSPIVGANSIKNGLYGCATLGGTNGAGGCYSLVPDGNHGLTETVLYNFGDQPNDPQSLGGVGDEGLVQADASGKLFGTSYSGGVYGLGTFFELNPPLIAGGAWTEKVDVSFNLTDSINGGQPWGTPLRVGGLYYRVLTGTQNGNGAVYELTP